MVWLRGEKSVDGVELLGWEVVQRVRSCALYAGVLGSVPGTMRSLNMAGYGSTINQQKSL